MQKYMTATTACALVLFAAHASAQLDVFTDFDDISSFEFTIGTPPIAATFLGGESGFRGDFTLYHSGIHSWMIDDGGSVGTVTYDTPASLIEFWARDSDPDINGLVTAFSPEGTALASVNLSTAWQFFSLSGLGPVDHITVENVSGPPGSTLAVDDFGFNAVPILSDPIPQPIVKGTVRVSLAPVATGLTAPLWLTDANDGTDRLFVVDQSGTIRLIKNGQLEPVPFLDVTSRLVQLGVFGTQDEGDFDERGFLGLAFHPNFAQSGIPGFGKLYTYTSEPLAGAADFTTVDQPPMDEVFDHQGVIAEWTVDPNNPDRVDPTSRREIMRFDEPQFNHNGGTLAFGPDGLLYLSLGDGGGADDENGQPFFGTTVWGHGPTGNGQNTSTIYGTIVRIDPLGTNSANGNYGIPADNPFVGGAGLDEIFVYGLRNPYRFSFDALTGDLLIGNVGQNQIEEVEIASNGNNFGWRLKEGSFRFIPDGQDPGFVTDNLDGLPMNLVEPVAEYDHDEGSAVIGGFVYRGSAIPELTGRYVFGDFTTDFFTPLGRVFSADLTTGEITELRLGNQDLPLDLFVKGFGQDADGELYLMAGTALGPFGNTSTIFKVKPICLPDFNDDGTVNTQDFLAFLNAWTANDSRADFNGDGTINTLDFIAYLNAFVAGCP